MYSQIQYLKHFLTATNQHGVHSPFVYDYITKCLYKKSNGSSSKSEKVLLKSIPYFSVGNFKIISKDSQIKKLVQKEFGLKASQEGSLDLIYQDIPVVDFLSIHQNNINYDTVILIDDIHKNKDATGIWETLRHDERVTVSIDMFYCGLLFFRKEQVKEHFKIRI